MPTDNLSDLASWHALVADCVVLGSHGAFLKHGCVEMSCIEAMLKPCWRVRDHCPGLQ